jgi:hypothetical protein
LETAVEASPHTNFFSTTESRVNWQQFFTALSFHSDDGVRLRVVSNDDTRSDDAVLEISTVETLRTFVCCQEANQTATARAAVKYLRLVVHNHKVNQSIAFELLLDLFCSDVAALKLKAVQTLASLVHSNEANQTAAASAGAVEWLMQLARSDDAALKLAAVETIRCVVTNHKDNQTAAARAGAFDLLMQLGRTDNSEIQRAAVKTFGSLVYFHKDNQIAFANAGVVELLMQLARSGDAEIQRECICSYLSFFAIPFLRRPQAMTSCEIRDELL